MAVMNRKDVENIIKDLQEKPFICSEDTIETVSGYIILSKEKNPNLRKRKQKNVDKIRFMSDEKLAEFLEQIVSGNRNVIGINCGNSKCESWKCTECISMWLQSEAE